MGDYDVFRSVIRAGNWTNPVAMPYAFNTTAANTSFILNNNAPGFVASIYDDKSEERNIYAIVGVDPADELTTAEGSVTLADGMQVEPSKAQLRLTDAAKGTLIKTVPLNNDGTFKFDFKPGEYKLYVSHEGYENDTISLSLPLYFLSQYMAVNSKLTPVETGESFLAITNILFEFDKYDLNSEARSALEAVKSILVNHPDLKIEVAGYTDAKGSVSYNLTLADKRAQAVIDYLTSPAIPASRFTKKSFGKSNFAAINTNSDGSDNPEGRKYNRRVTFGIVDPKTGIVLRQETYTPEHLRMASATKYSVVLLENAQRLSPGYFAKLDLGGMLFLKSFEEKSLYMYSVGIFYNNADATQFLLNVKDKGFTDAYVINQADLNDITKLKRTEPAFK
jgi:outer membrane protein OmpA-like peptidoglycan-associated protein